MDITVTNQQHRHAIEEDTLAAAARLVFADSSFSNGAINIAVVDDDHMQSLNRQYLEHDYPTDVLSFPLTEEADRIEGQIVVSADTAGREAQEYGWGFLDELTLYVVHGSLHLVGYRDKTSKDLSEMRAAEMKILKKLGVDQIPRERRDLTDSDPRNPSFPEVC